jgi:hypothetical protein
MRSHRLARLALLTKGAALVGLGSAAALGCAKDQPNINGPEPTVHINAPPQPPPSASALEPIHINAPFTEPQQHPHANATATPPSAKPDPQAPASASAAPKATGTPSAPRIRTNASPF